MRYSLAIANGCIAGPHEFNWIHRNNMTFAVTLRELVTAPYAFTILRCPFNRIASAFLDKIVSRERPFWSFTDAMNDKAAGDGISFRQFITALSKPAVLKSNPHWRPQTDFLVLKEYDDYFELEKFDHAVGRLRDRIGLEVKDARELSKHGASHCKSASGEPVCDTPAEALFAMKIDGVSPDLDSFYDDALRNQVREIYKRDFEFRAEKFGNGSNA